MYKFYIYLGDNMKIYLDYVFIINFLFDFILLIGLAILLKRQVSKVRLFLASFFGGVSGFVIFVTISSGLFFLLKMFFGLIIVVICFTYKNIRFTMNNFFYLIILSILLGGSLYLFNIEISTSFIGDLLNDRINYVIMLLLIGLIVTLVYAKYLHRTKQGIVNSYKVLINKNDKNYNYVGYLDTGNNLVYKKRPVLILNKGLDLDISDENIIYIPFVTVNGTGIMKCFWLKEIFINNKKYKNIYIGISNDKFYLNDADIILNINLWEGNNE